MTNANESGAGHDGRTRWSDAPRTLLALAPAALATLAAAAAPSGHQQSPCERVAFEALRSCEAEARSDYWLARAKCTNEPDFGERIACLVEAWGEYRDGLDACWERLLARRELCHDLGEERYAPELPERFVPLVDNPWLPLHPGTTLVYEQHEDGEVERIEVETTTETREVLGVLCTVVHDVARVDGEVVEDTFDWLAQDEDGNVWYFGELSRDFADGELVGLAGSWEAGEDGAYPGIVMRAAPQVGDLYRQEFLLREAEDVAGVIATGETVVVPYGTFTGCLVTEEYTPVEPDVLEHKYYAPGLGLVLAVDVESGARLELIDVLVE